MVVNISSVEQQVFLKPTKSLQTCLLKSFNFNGICVCLFSEEIFYHDTTGKSNYLKICQQYGLVPISYFVRHITDNEITMRYHGLSPTAAKAIALVLRVGTIKTIDYQ